MPEEYGGRGLDCRTCGLIVEEVGRADSAMRMVVSVLITVRVRARGAGSGVELDLPGWHVWTVRDGMGVHMLATFDEPRVRESFGARDEPSSATRP